MSFSKEVKSEILNKDFTLKKKHSKIHDGGFSIENKRRLADYFCKLGYLCDPQKLYLLEFVSSDEEDLNQIRSLLSEAFGSQASIKQTFRAGNYVLYIQDADIISDFLNLTGAHNSLLKFENMRILKEMRENIQRTVNCETANIKRTVNASAKQIEDIEYLEEYIGLENISEPLREIAELRLAKPDASLKELAELCIPSIGRSGVNHRLRKITNLVEAHKRSQVKGVSTDGR